MDHSKRYENTLVAILFLTWGTVFLDRMSQLYLAPYIVPEFHLTHSQVGMLASVLAITWAISTLVFGALSDRIGRRPILIPAVFAFSILSWLSGIAHSFHQLLLIRALMGIAESGKVYPKASHPIVRTHPVTKRKALYVNGQFTTHINGLPSDEGRAVLDFLCEFSTREEFQVRFRWQPHSVAFWDNRCVQHQALWDYYPQTRSGRRVTVKGERPL